MKMNLEMNSWAVIDESRQYRYSLSRVWEVNGPRLGFVMLNPSTADGFTDDPTIRRCIGFARTWGYGGLKVVNLYAYRATNPNDIWKVEDPVGPDNDLYIRKMVEDCSGIVAAWGAGAKDRKRIDHVLQLLGDVKCLGKTKAGDPWHPLYKPIRLKPQPYYQDGKLV